MPMPGTGRTNADDQGMREPDPYDTEMQQGFKEQALRGIRPTIESGIGMAPPVAGTDNAPFPGESDKPSGDASADPTALLEALKGLQSPNMQAINPTTTHVPNPGSHIPTRDPADNPDIAEQQGILDRAKAKAGIDPTNPNPVGNGGVQFSADGTATAPNGATWQTGQGMQLSPYDRAKQLVGNPQVAALLQALIGHKMGLPVR